MSVKNKRSNINEGHVMARDGTKLYYNVQGKGPAIILCSGIAVSFVYWKYLIEALRPYYRVIQWNYRGHGRSAPPRDYGHTSIDYLVDDLERLRSKLRISECVLLGYSVGVQVILEYYRKYPDRVVALIAALGSYGKPFDTFFHTPVLKFLFPFMYGVSRSCDPLMERIWDFIYWNPLKVNYHLARLTGITHWNKCKWEDFAPFFDHFRELDMHSFFEMAKAAQEHSAEDILPKVKVPTLVVGGGKDMFTPKRLSRHMAKLIPHSQYLEIPDATHTGMLEEPDLINSRILDFLHGLELN